MSSSPFFEVWMKIPATKGWSLVASRVTPEQARVWKQTSLFRLSFQPCGKEGTPNDGADRQAQPAQAPPGDA